VEETIRHIVAGRLNWFLRMQAPLSAELAREVPEWIEDKDGNRYVSEDALSADPAELIRWMERTWQMIETTLTEWTVGELGYTYLHTYWGKTYTISRQWTIWRILSHDIHHGGQLSLLLYMQGIEPAELGAQGGHLTQLPLADNKELL
jgi:uncharacterized damage-inducible protein DinB